MKKSELISKALKLRKSGLSYKAIGRRLGISYSTSYLWLQHVGLNLSARNRLLASQQKGREKAYETNKARRLVRDLGIARKARENIEGFKLDQPLVKILCSLLYWAEGGKTMRGVVFINSDPLMMKLFMFLLRAGFMIREDKIRATLHLHNYHDQPKQIAYWSRITGIPKKQFFVYNKVNSGKNIRLNYPGCLSVRYNDIRIFNEIKYTYKILARKYVGFI